jgi:hypothetical protein
MPGGWEASYQGLKETSFCDGKNREYKSNSAARTPTSRPVSGPALVGERNEFLLGSKGSPSRQLVATLLALCEAFHRREYIEIPMAAFE